MNIFEASINKHPELKNYQKSSYLERECLHGKCPLCSENTRIVYPSPTKRHLTWSYCFHCLDIQTVKTLFGKPDGKSGKRGMHYWNAFKFFNAGFKAHSGPSQLFLRLGMGSDIGDPLYRLYMASFGFSPSFSAFRHLVLNRSSFKCDPPVAYKKQSRPVLIAPLCIFPGIVTGFYIIRNDGVNHRVTLTREHSEGQDSFIFINAFGHKKFKIYNSLSEVTSDYFYIESVRDEVDILCRAVS